MNTITLRDAAWQHTFPFRIAPHQDEWLAGLLLRCDEANGWQAGTTAVHLLRVASSHVGPHQFNLMTPSASHLVQLSQMLAIPAHSVLATTYQSEMERFANAAPRLLLVAHESLHFALCPACIDEERLLRRHLMLSQITICQKHQLILQTTCQCGAKLRPFSYAVPFTCTACGKHWSELSQLTASAEQQELAQQLLSYYVFFFSHGTPEILVRTLTLIEERKKEKTAKRSLPLLEKIRQDRANTKRPRLGTIRLEDVVYSLMCFGISPDDIVASSEDLFDDVTIIG